MITIEEFYRAQEILSRRSNCQSHRFLNPDFPLKSLLRCPACRRPVTGSWSKGRHRRYAYYHCYFRSCTAFGRGTPKDKLESEFGAYLWKADSQTKSYSHYRNKDHGHPCRISSQNEQSDIETETKVGANGKRKKRINLHAQQAVDI